MIRVVYFFLSIIAVGFLISCKNNKSNENNEPSIEINTPSIDILILSQWKVGESATKEQIEEFGVEKCFVSCEIGDTLFSRIKGLSYKDNCTLPLSELRYIKVLHYNIDGKILLGEMICNKAISNDLIEIFKTLYNNCYPIEKMVLVDNYGADDNKSMAANNSSAFNYRFIPGTRKLSRHSLGLAIDINPLYNPYIRYKGGKTIVDPIEGTPYVDRTTEFPYKIDENDLCYKEFSKRGFTWGGNWKYQKDYQHFEKRLE